VRPVAASKEYRLGNVPETVQESLEPYSLRAHKPRRGVHPLEPLTVQTDAAGEPFSMSGSPLRKMMS
jgi:hypothetical protein